MAISMHDDIPIWITCPSCHEWLGIVQEADLCPVTGQIKCGFCGETFSERLAMNYMVRDLINFIEIQRALAQRKGAARES